MTTTDPIPEIRHEYLGSIPLLMTYFERLQIKTIVDQHVVAAPQATVSHGECVLALLTALFLGELHCRWLLFWFTGVVPKLLGLI